MELPQREEGALLVPELIRPILKVFEILRSMKGGQERERERKEVKRIEEAGREEKGRESVATLTSNGIVVYYCVT